MRITWFPVLDLGMVCIDKLLGFENSIDQRLPSYKHSLDATANNKHFSLAASTHDQDVFSFYPDERFCNGFEEVLSRYREIVPNLRLAGLNLVFWCWCFSSHSIRWSLELDFLVYAYHFVAGPTSFAPIIEMAMTIVEQSAGQYHVLLIIADGQVRFLFYSCNLNSETNKGQKCHAFVTKMSGMRDGKLDYLGKKL